MGIDRRDTLSPLPRAATFVALFALALAGALALITKSSGAQSIGELNSRIASAKEEAQALAQRIESTSAELAATQQRAIAAAKREAELSATLARGREREARLEAAVADATAKLRAARAKLAKAHDALSERLVAIYRSGMPDELSLLLDSDGWDDLATRAEYLKRIEEADAALVARVRELRNEVADRLAAVEDAEAKVEAHNKELAAARDQIAAARAQAEAQAAELRQMRAAREAAINELRSKIGKWTNEVARLERISQREARDEVNQWFGDWAIPESIVMCESGGDWNAVNPSSGAGGAYQILPSTWELYGGEGKPQDASPQEQSEIAAQIWADSGAAAWECAG